MKSLVSFVKAISLRKTIKVPNHINIFFTIRKLAIAIFSSVYKIKSHFYVIARKLHRRGNSH